MCMYGIYATMEGWMDGLSMHAYIDGWMEGFGWMDGGIDGLTYVYWMAHSCLLRRQTGANRQG